MNIDEILQKTEPNVQITVVNEPFECAGKLTLTLDGGEMRYWYFSSDERMLSISPDDEEIIIFRLIEEEFEPQGGMILFHAKEFELNYSDAGVVENIEGDVETMDEDRYAFADYESDDGDIFRLVTNENTGDRSSYFGEVVVADDILPVE